MGGDQCPVVHFCVKIIAVTKKYLERGLVSGPVVTSTAISLAVIKGSIGPASNRAHV